MGVCVSVYVGVCVGVGVGVCVGACVGGLLYAGAMPCLEIEGRGGGGPVGVSAWRSGLGEMGQCQP